MLRFVLWPPVTSSVLCSFSLAWSRDEGLSVLGFDRKCHEYMIIDWNKGSINKGGSVKYVYRLSSGQYPTLNKFDSMSARVASTVEECTSQGAGQQINNVSLA